MAKSDVLIFYCNGIRVEEENVDPDLTLLNYLRSNLSLTGTKAGCGQGGCGSCTVMVSSADPCSKQISHLAVVACQYPLCLVHGKAVITVEGLGSVRSGLHAIQERLAKHHGTQCGFCTPGIIMSVYALLRTNPKPSMDDILTAMEGNLCRCTGYRPILDGLKTFCGDDCACARKEKELKDGKQASQASLTDGQEYSPYDPTQEPIFPPDLLIDKESFTRSVTFLKGQSSWVIASSLREVLEMKKQHPAAPFVVGNTIIGNKRRKERMSFPLIISPGASIKELTQVITSDLGVTVGCGVTMSQLSKELKRLIANRPDHQTRTFAAIVNVLKKYASPQIRNMASIGGTVWSFSKFADLVPVFTVCGATTTLISVEGERTVPLDENFRKKPEIKLKETEIARDVFIPFTAKNEFCYAHKLSQRKRNCLATVNCAFHFILDAADFSKMSRLTIMCGGESALGPIHLDNRVVSQDLLRDILGMLASRVTQEVFERPNDLSGVEFKRSLIAACFIRSFVSLCRDTGHEEILGEDTALGYPLSDAAILPGLTDGAITSTQVFQAPPENQPDIDVVGRPLVNMSAFEKCSGETIFVDDIPPVDGELSLAPVLSTKPHAKILSIDASAALALKGVVRFLSHKDVPGVNGQILDPSEEVFVSETVQAIGQSIGAILATDRCTALRAVKLIKVQYQDLQPCVLTIQDAIEHNSYLEPEPRVLTRGDVTAAMATASKKLEGEVKVGGQDHCYLEPRACIARPLEHDGIDLTLTSQCLHNVQMNVAHCLGLSAHKVVCRSKQIGGAFGGKDNRLQFAMVTAVAAYKTRKPVRLCLERSDDNRLKGFRSPFLARYRAGFNEEGRIQALDVELYSDGGWSTDLSGYILGRAMLQLDSVYSLPDFRVTGYLCKTNLPSNTSMRGFGLPQGMATMEHIISDIALACGLPQNQVQRVNFKVDGEVMYPGQLTPNMAIVRKCWETCKEQSSFGQRMEQVQEFNRRNRWKKRGLAIIPTQHGIGFLDWITLNQGAALVHIYTDGSVLLHHGGIDVGQGLYTKCIQIASRVLGIPVEKIHTIETSTDKVPNTTVTSASTGTDLCGGAIKVACEELVERLKPFREDNPGGSWEQWVFAAYCDRVSLSATGLYKLPGITWSWETKTGNPFAYCTYGVGASEVEIDCLTGEHRVLRTDIVMEMGQSINPALDVGQIEGAFIQGYGLFTLEVLKMSKEGALLTEAPQTYKIPLASDIPPEFNVTILRDGSERVQTAFSSKGIGEPPLFLASSVFFAIKQAVASVRQDLGLAGPFCLNVPASMEEVRMGCGGDGLLNLASTG